MATRSALVVGFLVLGASTPVRYASVLSASPVGSRSISDVHSAAGPLESVAAAAKAKKVSLETKSTSSDLGGSCAVASQSIEEAFPTSSLFLAPAAASTAASAGVAAPAEKAPTAEKPPIVTTQPLETSDATGSAEQLLQNPPDASTDGAQPTREGHHLVSTQRR